MAFLSTAAVQKILFKMSRLRRRGEKAVFDLIRSSLEHRCTFCTVISDDVNVHRSDPVAFRVAELHRDLLETHSRPTARPTQLSKRSSKSTDFVSASSKL